MLKELGSIPSRLINVLTGGTADLPFSARAYRDDLRAARWIDKAARLLTGETQHCRAAWFREVHRAHQTVRDASNKAWNGLTDISGR